MNETKSNFETLEGWIKGGEIRNIISNLTKTFPSEEKYKLTDQMIRASRSVTANVAEGYGRFRYRKNIQFNRQARGSLYELVDHITVTIDENYIDNEAFIKIKSDIFEVIKLINNYIKYLKTKKENDK